MRKFFSQLLLFLVLSAGYGPLAAQQMIPLGSLEVTGRVRINKKVEKLQRKRFYLLPGGLAENKKLIDKMRAAEIVSRDCYYSGLQASPQFICWLKAENCESPYCREITETDIAGVPEFQRAFQKGLRQFGRSRPEIARNWLTTNLPPPLLSGYRERNESLLETLLNDVRPIQSTMTDSVSVKATFIDIPLDPANGGKSTKFLVSNLLPLEIGDKSYLWACEIEITADRPAKLNLKVPENDKPVSDCEVFVKDLPVCRTEECKK